MRKLLERAADLLFPPRCALCGEVLAVKDRAEGLCRACREEIPFFPADRCPRCGGKTDTGGFCEACLRPFAFESACAAFPYERVRTAIHLFKYRGGKGFGEGLGRLAAEYLRRTHTELLSGVDVMIPVPLHPKKERRRGFNQTILLCRAVSAETALPLCERGLLRRKDTMPQSLLSPAERKENLRGVFVVNADVAGKRVLLVDDIFTSGATCGECARALYRAGAESVRVFCLAAA